MKKLYTSLLLMVASFSAVQAQCTSTFGNYPPPFTTPASFSPDYLLGDKYTLSTGGTLTGLGYAGNGTNGSIQMAIYTDVSGNPGTLVAATYTGVVGTGNITLAIPTPTTIPAGDYWIMAVYTGGSSQGHVNYNGSSSQTVKYISLTFGTPPPNTASWSTYTGQDFNYWGVLGTPAISGISSSICAGQSMTLTSSPATSYTWSTGANTSSIAVTPTATTVYSLSVSSGTSTCSNTYSLTVNPSPTVSISGPTVACSGNAVTYTASGASTYTWNTSVNTTTLAANTSTTTSYTVTGTSAGCSSSAMITLSVTTTPTVNISSTFTTCAGNPVSMTASGATTYSWNTGATSSSIAPTPSTTTAGYTVTGYNGTCSNTAVAMVTVTPVPSLSVSSTSSLLCVGQTASLTINGATTYSWSTSATTSVIAVSPTTTTTYSVTGTTAGCASTTTIMQVVSACTGIADLTALSGCSLYPNPSSGSFTLETDREVMMTVTTVMGQQIMVSKLQQGKNKIVLNDQPEGVYFVKIEADNAARTIRIVKQN